MLTVFAIYLIAHFAAYAAGLRRWVLLQEEHGIFLYHFGSACVTGLFALAAAFIDPLEFGFAGLVLVLCIHGIYSLSFLELWSLAQGGYSLSVIAAIANAEAEGSDPDFSRLAQIGGKKQRDRVAGLEKLGLIAFVGEKITLTKRGNSMATMLNHLLRWVEPKAPS